MDKWHRTDQKTLQDYFSQPGAVGEGRLLLCFPSLGSAPITHYSSHFFPFFSTSPVGVFLLHAAAEAENVDEAMVGVLLARQLFR